jgi:3-hydroxybutyryl-CoA dehydrogenase
MDWPELEPLKAQRAELAEQNVYLAAASMAPGLPELLLSLGVEPSQEPERATVAIVAAMEPEAQRAEVAELEASLPEQALLLCQTVTGPLSSFMEAATRPDRIVGFDSLLAAPAEVVSLVAAPGAGRAGKKRAAGFFRALGKRVEWVNDAAGQVLPRILAMLVNEAAFCLQQGTASADDIDRAMELGVRYPRGPLAWGRQLGFERVVAVLEALHRGQQGRRYRAAELLRRWAQGSREGLS